MSDPNLLDYTTGQMADPTSTYYDPSMAGSSQAPVDTPAAAIDTSTSTPDFGALAALYAQGMQSNQSQAASPAATYTTGQMADPSSKAYDPSMSGANGVQSPSEAGVFSKILQGMGIQDKEGKVDYSDPKVFDKILKSIGIGGTILNTLMGPQNKKSATELSSQFKGAYDNFTPAGQAAADSYFNSPYVRHTQAPSAEMASPIVAGKRYAEGGGVEESGEPNGPLSLIRGADKGQADTVKANLSHGEYVFDADTVASLGDGNNEAGAKILDSWREEIRKHKRSAPPDKIPPKSKAPSHYLGKVK